MTEKVRVGKQSNGTEVRVEDRKGGGADIVFVKDGRVERIALTGNERETQRVLRDVKFDE